MEDGGIALIRSIQSFYKYRCYPKADKLSPSRPTKSSYGTINEFEN